MRGPCADPVPIEVFNHSTRQARVDFVILSSKVNVLAPSVNADDG
jgi:hypothetical protein